LAKNKIADPLVNIVSLCKRRGMIFPSSEIYGGVGSTFDYGPTGVEMKNNISRLWWNEMTLQYDNIVGLDSAVILHPKVWEASGHISGFTDPMIDCKICKARFRADQIDLPETGDSQCPKCGSKNSFTEARQFNLMFKTHIGPVEEDASVSYLRPETAQGIYLDWKIVQESSRLKVPFGIAQIGKSFRNEITPGNFIFRTREFEQMEMQFFVKPGETAQWLEEWRTRRMNWYLTLGVPQEKLRWHRHDKLAHYAQDAYDIEYEFPFGWSEIEGVHDRGGFDLTAHQTASGKDMSYFDDESKERYIPHIVETACGVNRIMLMLLCNGYHEDEQAGETRIYLSLSPKVAPIKAAFLSLVKKDGLAEIAEGMAKSLRGKIPIFLDNQGSIGKRYRRMDEIGTPFCFTVDYQTLEDQTVTVRWRDTLQQDRIRIDQVQDFLLDQLGLRL